MWRKNRGVNPGSKCVGTDLNRNWSFHWGGEFELFPQFVLSLDHEHLPLSPLSSASVRRKKDLGKESDREKNLSGESKEGILVV